MAAKIPMATRTRTHSFHHALSTKSKPEEKEGSSCVDSVKLHPCTGWRAGTEAAFDANGELGCRSRSSFAMRGIVVITPVRLHSVSQPLQCKPQVCRLRS